MHRPIHGFLAIASVSTFLFGSSIASSPTLTPTSWNETISLWIGQDGKELQGMDSLQPEAISDSLRIPGWGLSGALTYGPPGPPQFTVHSYGKRTFGNSSKAVLEPESHTAQGDSTAETRGVVSFEFKVATIAPPPIAVTTVPVTVSAHGATSIRGTTTCIPGGTCFVNGDPSASVEILVVSQFMTLMFRTVTSASVTGSNHIVNVGQTLDLEPDIVASCGIEAFGLVRMNRLASGQWGEATATISPLVEISTDLVPGTASPYSDYFRIEYGPGYWALGNPTSVIPATWGKIKSLYSKN